MLYFLIAGIILIDQVTKLLMVSGVIPTPQTVTGFFNIVLVYNTGVSFSMFAGDSVYNALILAFLAIAIAFFLIWWMQKEENPRIQIGLAFIAGGAIGNAIDRFLYGGVVDFLDFHWNNLHWPAFNIADTFICIGAAIIIFETIFSRKNKRI